MTHFSLLYRVIGRVPSSWSESSLPGGKRILRLLLISSLSCLAFNILFLSFFKIFHIFLNGITLLSCTILSARLLSTSNFSSFLSGDQSQRNRLSLFLTRPSQHISSSYRLPVGQQSLSVRLRETIQVKEPHHKIDIRGIDCSVSFRQALTTQQTSSRHLTTALEQNSRCSSPPS